LLWLSSVCALGACSVPSFDTFRPPEAGTLLRSTTIVGAREARLRPVTPEDLVDPRGYCAATAPPPPPPPDPESPSDLSAMQPVAPVVAPLNPGGIALEMTECDVVQRAGMPERVEIGGGQGPDRTAVLTYINGPRPGIYHFSGGRLSSMDRGPEPPPPPKPVKPQQRGKPPPRNAAMQ
jgi:hypothetical protein